MATAPAAETVAVAPSNPAATESTSPSAPVELQDLSANSGIEEKTQPTTSSDPEKPLPTTTDITSADITSQDANSKLPEGLGPATDLPIAALAPSPSSTAGPVLSITLMLTTGARHPYKIDERYLRNRKVDATNAQGSFDPREISGYKLKELIWTDWRSEWEPRPASPSSIRLIILGRLLEDKSALRDLPFKLDDINVVHMTVKPADFLDDDDTGGKTGKGHSLRGNDGEERGAGCRCVIL